MSFANYSAVPDENTSINGVNIAENCAAGNINNALRQYAADGKELHTIVTAISVANYMPLAGGAFTGNITRSGAGGFFYWNNASLAAGTGYVQLSTDPMPSSPAEGTIVFQYAA